MGIKIEKINIKDCGPIKEFKKNFKKINLIYSNNEGGKSLIVEFIIRALFKNKNSFGYIREFGSGKVFVSGLTNSIIEFYPTKKQKLEDYFEQEQKGLPSDFTKLMVVKEGETNIDIYENDKKSINEAGITKESIKNILSSKQILDMILKKIPKPIQNAVFNETIEINKTGIGKDYYLFKEKYYKIEQLLKETENNYQTDNLKKLIIKFEELKKKKELLILAKKYKAYNLSKEINEIEIELSKLPEQLVKKLEELLNEYKEKKREAQKIKNELEILKKENEELNEIKKKEEELIKAKRYKAYQLSKEIEETEKKLSSLFEQELNQIEKDLSNYYEKKYEMKNREQKVNELKEKTKDYEWLKSAYENYKNFLNSTSTIKSPDFIIKLIGIILFASCIISILFNQKFIAIILFVIITIIFIFYIRHFKKNILNLKQSSELENIKSEFYNRFNKNLENIVQLEELLKEAEKYKSQLEILEKDLSENKKFIDINYNKIIAYFKKLNMENVLEDEWQNKIKMIKDEINNYHKKIISLNKQLEYLNVKETEYEIKPSSIEFNQNELEKIQQKIAVLKNSEIKINNKNNELKILLNEIEELKNGIENIFKKFEINNLPNNEWNNKLLEIKEKIEKKKEELESKKGELKGLGISQKEYITEKPDIEYSFEELESIEKELEEINKSIENENNKLKSLKEEIVRITEAEFSIEWNDLLELLYEKRLEVEKELTEKKAAIIAGIFVTKTIEELQKEEDEKIIEGLNSNEVTTMLNQLTKRYKNFSLDNEKIIINDDYNEYNLSDLSTGAKEQIMLALRIGFLKRLFKQETAFLILDDAFQHSDYSKREILINTLFELANNDWQIIYCTMDDHIKNLFEEKSKNFSDFQLIHL